MLIILAGLPGVGKTTVARELARQLGAVHVRIDSIEQAIREAGCLTGPMNDAGYRVGYAVAEDNLRLGRTVIADSVNPLALTRDAWRAVATRSGAPCLDVEIACSRPEEHRRRVEARGWPSWADVVAREYHPRDDGRLVIDTAARSLEESVKEIVRRVCNGVTLGA